MALVNKSTKQKNLIAGLKIDAKFKYIFDEYSIFIDSYGYIVCDKTIDGKKTRRKLHQLIVGSIPKGMCIDHKNGDIMDNRISNLHVVTNSYNLTNKPKRKDSQQEYKGIEKLPSGRFRVRKQGNHLGTFDTAAEAYNFFVEFSELSLGKKLYNLTN